MNVEVLLRFADNNNNVEEVSLVFSPQMPMPQIVHLFRLDENWPDRFFRTKIITK